LKNNIEKNKQILQNYNNKLRGNEMPRPPNQFTPSDNYVAFRKAFSKLNQFIASGEYIAAHVIAFSILEDRVLANRLTCQKLKDGYLEINFNPNNIPFNKSTKKLLEMEVIDEKLHKQLSACGKERNEFIHQAMWRLDDFNLASIVKIRKTIRALEKCKTDFVRKQREGD